MKELNQLINKTNSSRMKLFYNLSELEQEIGMSNRAVKYRMLYVKKKYKDVPSLLSKKNREWHIHYTLLDEFLPKYNLKNKNIYTFNWISMATWNPKFNYDIKYHVEIVNQIKKELPENTISYAVELDSRGFYHTHLISDAETSTLRNAVNSTLLKYVENPKEIQALVEPIIKKCSAVTYLRKNPQACGII